MGSGQWIKRMGLKKIKKPEVNSNLFIELVSDALTAVVTELHDIYYTIILVWCKVIYVCCGNSGYY